MPQYIPYPVPQLRGPEPVVPSQASLVQLLEALKPLKAPVTPAPLQPTPAPIPEIVEEKTEEVGPTRMVAPPSPVVKPVGPMVSAEASSSSASTPAERAEMAATQLPASHDWTEAELRALNEGKSSIPGGMTLRKLAKELGVIIPRNTNKDGIIDRILTKLRSIEDAPSPALSPSPVAPKRVLFPRKAPASADS